MNVADFETCTVAVQATRSESGKTTFVRQLCKRVGLVHELGKLATTEEVAHYSAERLGIDQLGWHHALNVHIEQSHALFDETFCASQADAALVGKKFADSPNAT